MAMGAAREMTNRTVRTAVTITCFLCFGVGGAILSAVFFPLLRLIPGTRQQRQSRARGVIGYFFRLLMRVLVRTGCMRLETAGLEDLDRASGTLIIANHPSYIDVVALLSVIPEANCVVKGDLWRNPFYWSIVRSAGYINNASPDDLVESCTKVLAQNEPLVLFPEGTRTIPGQTMRFQRGAARIALLSKANVIPVLISCEPRTLAKGDPWWLAPERPFTFRIEVHAPLPTEYFVPAPENSPIGARRFTEALQHYFSRELKPHGYA